MQKVVTDLLPPCADLKISGRLNCGVLGELLFKLAEEKGYNNESYPYISFRRIFERLNGFLEVGLSAVSVVGAGVAICTDDVSCGR